MAVSVIPALIDALVVAARAALPSVRVFDGVGVTDDPGDFLMVGVDDPDTEGHAFAAESQQEFGPMGTTRPRDERGQVTCAAFSWNGSSDPKAARDAAYASVEALASACRTNPSLGVAGVLWTSFGPDARLTQSQGDFGADALVVFSVSFRARI